MMKSLKEKRKHFVPILIMILIVLRTYLPSYADVTPVSERTPQVRDAIVAAVPGVNNAADVTEAHLAKITLLDIGNKVITSLKSGDFEGLTALTSLYLDYNSISDISALEDLTALTYLNLSNTSISDISPLQNLTKLRQLYLEFNSISDISPLQNLTKLRLLYLGYNSISDISALQNMTALTSLDLHYNSISDISALEDLTSLTNLYLSYNSISDISVLENLTALTGLGLSNNSISDISVLENLTALTGLSLSHNSISDISALQNMTALIELLLDNNSISDISTLQNMTALTRLYLSGNSISDISALGKLTALEWLWLGSNSISDISPLADVTGLQHLFLSGNPISDYDTLRGLKTADPNINIDIDNFNNNPPRFSDDNNTTRSVAENTAPGTNIGTVISATDADNHILIYSLSGTDASLFSIISTSGQLQTKAPLDYETKTSYTVTVTVYDGNNGGDQITITINVTDVFDPLVGRTQQVQDAIVRAAGVQSAADVTEAHLAAITSLDLEFRLPRKPISSLKVGDFSGLTALTELNLLHNDLSNLPAGIFDDLTNLTNLYLSHNGFSSLSSDIFDELTALQSLTLSGNYLTSLPADIFDELTALTTLDLYGNALTSLPAGIFNELTALTSLNLYSTSLASLPAGIFDDLTNLTTLVLTNNALTSLPVGIFNELTNLTNLYLGLNQLSSLPDGVFEGLTALRTLRLGGNTVDPMPINISLKKVADGQFKAVVPTGAPFDIVLPVSVTNGSISGGATSITISKGSVESGTLTVTRTPSTTTAAVTVNIGTLPGIPSGRSGYALHKSTTDLPLTVITERTIDPPLSERTPEVRDAIVVEAGVQSAVNVTAAHLAAITTLNLKDKSIKALKAGDFDGLTALTTLNLFNNDLSALPAGIFDELTELTSLALGKNALNELPTGIFDGLTALTHLWLNDNDLTSLPASMFANLTNPPTVFLNKNKLTSLPDNFFAGLTTWLTIILTDNLVNPLPLTVSLEKVGTDQFKAVAPIGAPFDIVLPLTITNGSISGGASSITISRGSTESGTLTATRISGTTAAAIVDIDTLPSIPSGHLGYTLVKSTDLPLEIIAGTNNDPVFTDGTSTTRTIAENTTIGQHIGAVISATDADNDTLTYTLGGIDAAAFGIDATTGQLQTSTALDYETKSSYSVTVNVSDGNGGSDSITVTINVTDIDETPITPVSDRTPQVQVAIISAIPNVSTAAHVTATHLAAITSLNLRNAGITALKTEDFSGMTGLTSINLFNNQLISLPDGIFEGLTSLTTIRLGRNTVDPLPLTVSLEKVGTNQFKAVAPTGATFDIVLPITVTNGNISGGTTTLTIPHGSVESGPLTVTRTPGTTAVVTVDIGTLPSLPRNHFGYALVKSGSLPLDIITGINTAPVFTGGVNTTRSVAENSAAGTHIGTAIAATDTESDTLTYTLSGTDASAFEIDSTTGQLKTKAALDYETKTNYTVTITVSDGSLTATITVTINITDIDEVVTPPITPDPPTTNSAPYFYEGDSTTRVIAENTPAGVDIGNAVLATDANNDFLAYTLGGVDADSFDIDSDGQLKTKATLDYETKSVYTVTITVDDEELSNTITVIISVIDVNDTVISVGFVPVADRTPAVRDAIVAAVPNVTDAANVTESQVAAITDLNLRGKSISSLKTGDFSGMTALTSLNLFRNNLSSLPPGIFDGLTALITLRLGGNAVDPIPLIVSLQQVGDGQFKAAIATGAPFNIVLPINVTNGSISGGATSVTIPKGSMESATFTVSGTSPKVTFGTLPGLPSNHFGYVLAQSNVCNRTTEVAAAIATAVGVSDCSGVTEVDLATITTLDLSGQSIASLSAGDFAGMFSLKTLYLDNNDLTSLPNGIFDNLVSLGELFLNSNKLTTVPGGIFSNLSSLTNLYLQSNRLSSLPSDAFEGLSDLRSINLQDNELASLPGNVFNGIPYLRSILLSNNKLTSISNGIFKGLTQLNQLHLSWNPNPSSQLSLTVSLQKVGTNQLKAVAPSGAPFAIVVPISVKNGTLAGGATALRIPIGEVESLPITVTRTPGTTDAVTADIGTLPNRPSLHNGYALAKAAGLPLEVLPPVNSPPVFTDGASTTRTVAENTVEDTNIGTAIAATDREKDKLTYTLGGTDAASFSVDSATGQLKTKAALDYETKTSYTVTVVVSDGLATDAIGVTINVIDVDENRAPVFTDGTSTTRTVAENTAAGTNIAKPVDATDADNDTLTYSLSGTDASAFIIDTSTGQLKTSAALDYETKAIYSVSVTVSDGKLTDTIVVTINVTDVAERSDQEVIESPTNNAPIFTEGSTTTRTVLEDTPSGVDIGAAVSATDADGHSLTYSLGGTDAAVFSMDTTNGQLRTNAALDFETKSSYAVTITASDGTDTATIDVTINVSNATENSAPVFPVFIPGVSVSRSVAENTGSGVDIGTPVAATDVDGDTLTYTLSGTDAAAFSIGSTSGQLRTSAALDYETKTSYSVTITVSDGNGGTDSINVVINITDVDETPSNNEPVFTEGSSTSRSVLENTGSGVDIGSAVSATDADGDTLTYSISGTDASAFSIDSFTGQLRTSSALDYETENSYSVVITASDGSLTSSINVTIDVIDANEAPVFTDGSSTSRIVAENVAIGANIGTTVSATDADGDNLTYSLGGTDAAAFGIDNTTGQLQTNTALNTTTKTTYSVNITASDGSLTDSITVTINVRSVNDAPVFTEGNSATRSIAEHTAANTNIGTTVSATDADGDTITYTLGGTDAAAFSINNTNGQLRTNAVLNFETKATYSVTITASDGNLSDSIAITINVTDANDAPVFTGGTSTIRSIAENTGAAINIGTAISATDEDDDTLTYTLGGTDAAAFDINSTNGQLQTKAALDFEDKNRYTVTVSVNDGNNGTDTINVTINVTDLEETPANNPPVFTDGNSTTRSIAENSDANTNIGTPVAATDADNNTLAYTLSGPDAASFGIDSTTGQLKTNASLDHETNGEYSVTVNVNDGSTSVSITVTINVIDANDAPVFTDGTSATRTIAENTASGTNIGTAIPATDQDGDDLTYTLGGTDEASFSIVSTSGQLQTSAALNYENRSSYAVTITVSDGNLTDTIDVTINITDANDAPAFTEGDSATRSVAENTDSGENIGAAVSATDPDTDDTLTYTLGDDDAASFSIDSTSGQLQTKASLDYETEDSYSVTISVSDGNGGSDSIDVTINVTDINENRAPVFTDGDRTTRSVAENTDSGTNIGSAVSATDPDADDTLTYTLGGDDAASFSIVSTSGQLQTKASLDYETEDEYSVTVSVSDGNGGNDSIDVTINVTDVDENRAPSFTDGDSATRSVAENTGSGEDIGTAVSATDPDNDTLEYTLGGDDASSFSINSTNGQLRTNAALDYETETSYTVTITVSDGKGKSDSITVTINVTDVDENRAPSFTDGSSTTRSVAENTGSGVDIGNAIGATDPDNDTLIYTLGGDDAASFSINSTNGQLRTSAALNYESKTLYSVSITVSDGSLTDSITVTINVTNVNEAPAFKNSTLTRSVAENTATGTNLGNALDVSDPEGNSLTYTLGGTDAASFSFDSTNRKLQTKAALDYETKPSYTVVVTVSDGSLTDSITITINVTNVNEQPTFASGASISNISATEDTAITSVTLPEATDPDANATITYTLTPGLPAGLTFTVSTRVLAGTPTAEKTSTTYTYKASDGNLSSTLTFTIQVSAPANNAPIFTDGTSTTRSVAENTTSGTNIGTPVAATDADSDDTLTYSLGGTDSASFSIVSTSGQLQTSAALDYETKDEYSVIVSVSDGNGGSDSISVTINVTDVTETTFTPVNQRTQQVQDAIVAAIDGIDSADDVTAAHLAAITSLNLDRKSITSLKSGDFDGLTALTTLDLRSNSISDISPLEHLTKLTYLHLGFNSISDISALEDLTALTSLHLMDNSISDISVLENFTALTNLSLSQNSISDISALENLTKLINLRLNENSISDISALEDLTALTILSLSSNSISDISALENFTALTSLSLGANSISDISALNDLTALTYIDLWGNSISDISTLEDLTALTHIDLSVNPISDYSPLRRLKTANPDIDIDIDLNNNPPVFSEGSSTTRSIAENTASGTNIGTTVAATDADTSDTLTYRLSGTDASSFSLARTSEFSLARTSAQLQTKAALDYETKNSYSVTITVYDGNSGGDRITVTINVTDEEGAAPSVETPPIIPDKTALLTNFPNPFNPETWIPFQLAKPSEVTITIYDIRGRVVRVLVLGHQAAGVYRSRSKAAHWDGRNHFGEKVATSVYFYTLTAGDFTATRKMLIRK